MQPTDDEIKSAYEWSLAYAASVVRGQSHERVTAAQDAVTDGVVWACQNYDPSKGEFKSFVHWVVRLALSRHLERAIERKQSRPRMIQLSGFDEKEEGGKIFEVAASGRPSAGRVPLGPTIDDLPDELKNAVRLYFVDGYGLRECGELLGVAPETVRLRLRKAACMIDPEGVVPKRSNGEKRLLKGRASPAR